MAYPRGFPPVAAAIEKAIGVRSSTAALFVMISLRTMVTSTIAARSATCPKGAATPMIHSASKLPSPETSIAAASPNAAAMVTTTSRSIERRASAGVTAPKTTSTSAPSRAAVTSGMNPEAARTTIATPTAATNGARGLLTGGAGRSGEIRRKSRRSPHRLLKPGSAISSRVSPTRSSMSPILSSMRSPARWTATIAAW